MNAFEAPRAEDLDHIEGVDVTLPSTDEPWIVSVTARADDGAQVTMTWDVSARSVAIKWIDEQGEVMALERETVTKVAVGDERSSIWFHVLSRSEGLSGELQVRIGDRVNVRDTHLVA